VTNLWQHKFEHEPILNQMMYKSYFESSWFRFNLVFQDLCCLADTSNRHEDRVHFSEFGVLPTTQVSSCRCLSCGHCVLFRWGWSSIKDRRKCKEYFSSHANLPIAEFSLVFFY